MTSDVKQTDLEILSTVAPLLFNPLVELQRYVNKEYEPLITQLYLPAKVLGDAVDLDIGMSAPLFAMISTIFLSLCLSLIPSPLVRKFHSTGWCIFFSFYSYGTGYLCVIIHFTVIYLVIAVLPRKMVFYVGCTLAFASTGYLLYLDFLTGLQMKFNCFMIVMMING